ncbi:THO complex subunit 4A [Nymphaea thermarum]|nr:THO complex subunit 4A [Nymphaea thermarum]
MSNALDMTLDDLIKGNKKPAAGAGGGGSRGRGRGGAASGAGPARRFPNRVANRSNPYGKLVLKRSISFVMEQPMQKAPETAWQHDMFMNQAAAAYPGQAARSIETGTMLYISNLDYGVSNEDVKELFSEVGDLKRFSIHYDRSGRSKGTAEVVFTRRSDAAAAVKRYNNVQLDGKPMKIEIVGTNLSTSASIPQVTNGLLGNPNGLPRSNQGRGAAVTRMRGGGGGRGSGRGRGRGKGHSEKISTEDLDADLDKYHSEAMQIN